MIVSNRRGGVVRMSDAGPLCVHAHPDDEAIWNGGALARYADAGVRTGVVTYTGERSTVRLIVSGSGRFQAPAAARMRP